MAGRKLVVEIVGDTKDLEKAFGRAEGESKKFGGAMKLGLGAATAGLAGLGVAAKLGFDEFNDAQRVMAQTEAVLKSTGGVAKVTAGDVTSLSEALMKKSGVDDEAIQSGENMLLTFTKIRNEVGAGNDIFNQAAKASLDLSVAMGKDMQSSAILVGKALNDPIKGMSALSRAGIQFTQAQKDTIKGLVESGDAMGAQKIILKELETQFGGSAEAAGKTFSGQMNIAKQTALNFAGDVVAKVVPALADVVAFIQQNWPKIRQVIEDVTNDIRALWKQWGDEIMAVVEFVFPVIERVVKNTLKIIQGIIDVFVGTLTGDWSRAWDGIKAIVGGVLDNIETMLKAALTLLGKAAQKVGEAIFDGIKNAVEGIAGAVWDLISGIGTKVGEMAAAIVGWGTSVGSKIKNAAVDGIKGIGGAIWDLILEIGRKELEGIEIIKGWGTSLANWIKNAAVNALKGIGQAVWNILLEIGQAELAAIDTVKGWGTQLATWLKDGVVNGLKGIGAVAWEGIKNIGSFIADKSGEIKGWGAGIIHKIVAGIEGAASDLWNAVTGIFDKLPGFVKKILGIGSPSKVFADIGKDIVSGLVKGLENKAGDLRNAATDMAKQIAGDAWDKLSGVAKGAGSAIAGAAGAVGGAIGFGGGEGVEGGGGKAGYVYGDIVGLASSLLTALRDMSGAAGRSIYVQSGFRSFAEQAALVAKLGLWSPSNPTGAAAPGTSKHETGRAADITPGRELFGWLASRFGLTFPIPQEPWHVESYDKGGILKPGLTLAYNGTRMNEYVSRARGGGTIINVTLPNYLGNERDVARALRDELRQLDRIDNGGRAFNSHPTFT